jgi:hypothetical protein
MELLGPDGISLLSVQNKTGDPSDCGTTDIEGNIAYFNKLCVGSLNGNSLINSASAFGGISDNTNQTIPSGTGTWTARTWNSLPAAWQPGPAFDFSNQGIRLNKLGLYLFEADFHATGTSTNWYTGILVNPQPSPIVAATMIVPLSAVGQVGMTHFYLNTAIGTIISLAATGNTNYQLDGTYLYAAFLMP